MLEINGQAMRRLGKPALTRLAALICMLVLIIAFRHLALMAVSFVLCARALSWLGGIVGRSLRTSERVGVMVVLLGLLLFVCAAVLLSVRLGSDFYLRALAGRPLLERLTALQRDVLLAVPAWVPLDDIKDRAPHLITPALTYVRATGRLLLMLLIGLILAIVYLMDRGEIDGMVKAPPEESLWGTLRRYLGFLGEAVVITIQLQLLVALVNTVLTLPVLLLLGLPHIPAFTAVIFLSSLVPVVGNLISGTVLVIASYAYRGLIGVVIFLVITFVLHKIEAYYLNPRLTARHVHLPSLVLIVSLIAFEHVFGLLGLFLSFPSLYVGIKIYQDFRAAALGSEAEPPGSVDSAPAGG